MLRRKFEKCVWGDTPYFSPSLSIISQHTKPKGKRQQKRQGQKTLDKIFNVCYNRARVPYLAVIMLLTSMILCAIVSIDHCPRNGARANPLSIYNMRELTKEQELAILSVDRQDKTITIILEDMEASNEEITESLWWHDLSTHAINGDNRTDLVDDNKGVYYRLDVNWLNLLRHGEMLTLEILGEHGSCEHHGYFPLNTGCESCH